MIAAKGSGRKAEAALSSALDWVEIYLDWVVLCLPWEPACYAKSHSVLIGTGVAS